MERHVTAVFCLLFASAASLPAKQYRTDYEYNRKTDAFYKLHIESERPLRAKEVCATEGAKLMMPASKEDVVQLHGMLKKFPDIGDLVTVDNDGQQHESAEEVPLIDLSPRADEEARAGGAHLVCDVVTRKGQIETDSCWNQRPFICKVEAKDALYDSQCGVYGAGYKYISSVNLCYKVPMAAYTWDAAYAECREQGAHLAVLKSEAQHLALKEFLHTAPRVESAHTNYFYYVGIRANKPTDGSTRVFRTIFNETLEEAGYSVWSEGEPNNHENSEYCGTVFRNTGKLNDVDCKDQYAFICEKEHTAT